VDEVADKFHSSFGVLVANMWRLDDSVKAGIGFHHEPLEAPEEHRRLVRAVQVAHRVVHVVEQERLGIDFGGRELLCEMVSDFDFVPNEALQKAYTIFDEVEGEMDFE